ncbi:hypothetical protein Q4485_11595, partial [Granulosicoccaceae sp. 1_MG-2023]|nr:hypothetical protein [Granulosicoccaceae sp. 1_MG-2023]
IAMQPINASTHTSYLCPNFQRAGRKSHRPEPAILADSVFACQAFVFKSFRSVAHFVNRGAHFTALQQRVKRFIST